MSSSSSHHSFVAHGQAEISGQKFLLPLHDDIKIIKTERKKIQIIISGPEKKGVCNNENSPLFQAAKDFFAHVGFSFGIEIHLTKNIAEKANLGEFFETKKGLLHALKKFSGNSHDCSLPKILIHPRLETILFPEISLPEKFLIASMGYQNIPDTAKNREIFVRHCFYEIDQKFLEHAKRKISGEISAFGLIGSGPSMFVIKH